MDFYQTLEEAQEGVFKDRGSKFIAYAHPVTSLDDIQEILIEINTIHPKARHVCYAYSLGMDDNNYRINDDGEPSGTAGRPIFNEIKSADLSDVFIAVVRYFGGTKLGVPGLINAYKMATKDALSKTNIITKYLTAEIHIEYPHHAMGKLYDILKRIGIEKITNDYQSTPRLIIHQRLSLLEETQKRIYAQYHGYGIEDIQEDFVSKDITIEIKPQ